MSFAGKLERFLAADDRSERAMLERLEAGGLSRSTVRAWVTGTQPRIDKLRLLADATAIHIAYWTSDDVPVMPTAEARAWSQRLTLVLHSDGAAAATAEHHCQMDLVDRCAQVGRQLIEDLTELCRIQRLALDDPSATKEMLARVDALRQGSRARARRTKG